MTCQKIGVHGQTEPSPQRPELGTPVPEGLHVWDPDAGKRNVNYSETEEHKIKPHKLRTLRDHECVAVHCERGFLRVTLPPLEFDGTVSPWFSQWKRSVWR